MYTKIKQLADEALALQNKDRMDAALREISALCAESGQVQLAEMMAVPIAEFEAEMASLDSEFEAARANADKDDAKYEAIGQAHTAGLLKSMTITAQSVQHGAGKKGGKK